VRFLPDPFANPIRGGVTEVNDAGDTTMVYRGLFVFWCCCVYVCFLGCKSQPALYEIIEVKHGEKMLDMHRCIRGGQAGQMPEVPTANRSWHRQNQDPAKACRDDSPKGKAVLGAGQLFHAVFR
jgi:hypothetical protein